MKDMFRALKVYNYRLWVGGALVSNIGTWMQRVAQDWLVLTILTDHSGTAVGITTGLQFLPIIFIGPFAGLLGDRIAKRKILLCTQTAMAICALTLGLRGRPKKRCAAPIGVCAPWCCRLLSRFGSPSGKLEINPFRGYGAVGSASAWHAEGQGFESPYLHRRPKAPNIMFGAFRVFPDRWRQLRRPTGRYPRPRCRVRAA